MNQNKIDLSMEVVTFEIAKKLKEKGFPQEPKHHYINNYYEWDGLRKIHPLYCDIIWYESKNKEYLYYAPTISQVLKWLREEEQIFIRVTLSYDYSTDADGEQVDRWTFWLFEVFSVGSGSLIYTEEISEYDSYEQATLAGIEYVIDNNLI